VVMGTEEYHGRAEAGSGGLRSGGRRRTDRTLGRGSGH
jgi:hypothetical protein